VNKRTGRTNVVFCKWQPELLSAFLELGADVYLVLDRYDLFQVEPHDGLAARCRKVYRIGSFDSVEELAAVAADLRTGEPAIDLVLSHNELSQLGAGYLELLLGTATEPSNHVSHRDKRLMKQRVRDAGVATARFRSLPDPTDRAAVAAVAKELRMPVIVKPAAGYGAMSTVRADDVAGFTEAVMNLKLEPLLRSRQLIVEEFVVGTELAVDAIWSHGKPLTFVVHQYHEPRLNMNDPTSLDGSRVYRPDDHPELYGKLRDLHDRVNGALGIRDCATHMEVFVRPDGEIVFSEIAARVGGAWIPGLLSAQLGHSIWHLLAQAALSGTCPLPRPAHRYVAAVHVRPVKPGVISSFPSDSELAAFPGMVSWRQLRHVGERARLNHPSDYYLHIVVGAGSADELEALCRRVAQTFTIDTTAS